MVFTVLKGHWTGLKGDVQRTKTAQRPWNMPSIYGTVTSIPNFWKSEEIKTFDAFVYTYSIALMIPNLYYLPLYQIWMLVQCVSRWLQPLWSMLWAMLNDWTDGSELIDAGWTGSNAVWLVAYRMWHCFGLKNIDLEWFLQSEDMEGCIDVHRGSHFRLISPCLHACVCVHERGGSSAGGYSGVKSCDGLSIALHLATHHPSLIPDKFLNCSKMWAPRGGVAA